MAAFSATKERRQAESYKAWTWPLLGVVLVGLGFLFGLEGRSNFVWVNCLGAWCLVRVCDHQLALLGPVGVAVVPLFVWSFGLFWKIRRWEEQ